MFEYVYFFCLFCCLDAYSLGQLCFGIDSSLDLSNDLSLSHLPLYSSLEHDTGFLPLLYHLKCLFKVEYASPNTLDQDSLPSSLPEIGHYLNTKTPFSKRSLQLDDYCDVLLSKFHHTIPPSLTINPSENIAADGFTCI